MASSRSPRSSRPTGVGAYNGAAREITNKTILGVAGSIVAIEARHTAIINALINPTANPVPKAFEAVTKPAGRPQRRRPDPRPGAVGAPTARCFASRRTSRATIRAAKSGRDR